MPTVNDRFKSSYGAFATRERELARSRARRDARDVAREPGDAGGRPAPASDRPLP